MHYKSDVLKSLHEAAKDTHIVGVTPKHTMRNFDAACLNVPPLSAEEIKEIRVSNGASQSKFARALNISTSVVSKWERGEQAPGGPSLKLLHVVKKRGLAFVEGV